jgi:hypothetical protein
MPSAGTSNIKLIPIKCAAQEHIITNSLFRQCGYRSSEFAQYETSPTRGCDGNGSNGCHQRSTTFGFLTHSDQFTPEIMQGTNEILFENCGRRFYLSDFRGDDLPDTVSGRGQNWIDVDGSASGLNEPTIIVSGLSSVKTWLEVDGDGESVSSPLASCVSPPDSLVTS